MKFTKEEFSEKLKSMLTANGKKLAQSERTFNASVERIYRRLEKRDEEIELDEAVADYLPDFEEIEGNMRKDNTDFIKQWEKDHPKKEEPKTKEEPKSEYEMLLQEFKELKEKMERKETEEHVASIRKNLKKSIKESGVEDSEWIDRYLAKINIHKDTDIEAEKEDALKIFNFQNSHVTPDITPRSAGGGTGGQDEDFADIVAIRKRAVSAE